MVVWNLIVICAGKINNLSVIYKKIELNMITIDSKVVSSLDILSWINLITIGIISKELKIV